MLFVAKQTIVSPTSFQFSQSFYVLASVIIGGMGSVPGAIVGGFLFVLISESLQGVAQSYSSVVFSLALLAVIVLRPKGIWPASFHSRLRGMEAQPRPASESLERIRGRIAEAPARATARGEPLLRVRDVSMRFGGVQALDRVSLSVENSEIVSVIGPNGAGKTTLLNAISGFIRPQEGSIEFRGRSLSRLKVEARARLGLARTFQTPRLLPTLNVLENVMQGAHISFRTRTFSAVFGISSQRGKERSTREEATDILGVLGLLPSAGANPTELSYGGQRRCEIARCLALGPALILLDEPAAGMNAKETDDLGELLLRIRDLGVTLLLIDHDMSLVRKVSDRVIALDRGAQVAEGGAQDVLRHPAVVQSYLGA